MGKKERITCCTIPNCNGRGCKNKNGTEIFSKGYCGAHYEKFRKYGNPLVVKQIQGEGRGKHPLYRTYTNMKRRCCNPKNKAFQNYGDRGIEVCPEWLGPEGFSQFLKDMGERPKGNTLDRIKNELGYSKSNCRWATVHEQCANRRSNNEILGVYWSKQKQKWLAKIMINRKQIHLGFSASHELASQARREAEKQYGIIYQEK